MDQKPNNKNYCRFRRLNTIQKVGWDGVIEGYRNSRNCFLSPAAGNKRVGKNP